MWPQTSLRTGVIKAAVETISYTPGAMTCFYFIMSLLESKTVEQAVAEVGKKFLPTYKVLFWDSRENGRLTHQFHRSCRWLCPYGHWWPPSTSP